MFKYLLTLIATLVLFQVDIFCQQYKHTNFFIKSADSVVVSTISYSDKTTWIPPDSCFKVDSITKLRHCTCPEPKSMIVKTASVNLTSNEIQRLIYCLGNSKLGHALPLQFDIQFDFYKKSNLTQTVTVSSYTKNLSVKRVGCNTYIDKNNNEIDPCFFLGTISKDFKKYIVKILINKKLWGIKDRFFEDL